MSPSSRRRELLIECVLRARSVAVRTHERQLVDDLAVTLGLERADLKIVTPLSPYHAYTNSLNVVLARRIEGSYMRHWTDNSPSRRRSDFYQRLRGGFISQRDKRRLWMWFLGNFDTYGWNHRAIRAERRHLMGSCGRKRGISWRPFPTGDVDVVFVLGCLPNAVPFSVCKPSVASRSRAHNHCD